MFIAFAGTTGDYVVLNDLATYAWTLETFGDFLVRDVFQMFNPVSKENYEHTIKEWVGDATNDGIIDQLLDDKRR